MLPNWKWYSKINIIDKITNEGHFIKILIKVNTYKEITTKTLNGQKLISNTSKTEAKDIVDQSQRSENCTDKIFIWVCLSKMLSKVKLGQKLKLKVLIEQTQNEGSHTQTNLSSIQKYESTRISIWHQNLRILTKVNFFTLNL